MSSRCIFLFKHIAGCAIGEAQPCTQKHIVGQQEGVDLISTSWHLTSPSQQYVSPCVSCLFRAKTAQRYPKAQIITLRKVQWKAQSKCLSSWQHGASRKPAANRQRLLASIRSSASQPLSKCFGGVQEPVMHLP